MGLLNPYLLLGPMDAGACSGFSPPPSFQHGFDRTSFPVPDIVDGDKVYVAVGKSVEKAVSLLHWTFRRFRRQEICILHVLQPSPFIPTPLGKLPATQANEDVLFAYRRKERAETEKLLLDYMSLCSRSKVNACYVTTENDQIRKGIVDLVKEFGVRKLVMGAVPENWMKVKKSSSKSNYVAENAPSFCQIWFVNKSQLLYTRAPAEGSGSLPASTHQDPKNLRTQSVCYSKSEVELHQEFHRSTSITSFISGSTSTVRGNQGQGHGSHRLSTVCRPSTTSSDSGYSSSAEFDLEAEEESLNRKLEEVIMEAEASRNEAFQELLKQKRFEAQALEANNELKASESAHAQEVELRKAAENTLNARKREQEQLLQQKETTEKELHKAMRSIAILDNQVQEGNRRWEETAEELELIEASITTLKIEKQTVQRQRSEAADWLDRWKFRGQAGEEPEGASATSRLTEFSLLDLQTATCNFSESFKIRDEGCGSVYKGEILNMTVTIKKLHPNNLQRQSEFQREVQVLGKLQHKHLLALVGTCPEASALVYEYMPHSLEIQLSCKSWKTRTRLISQIANVLLFLHSSRPEKIIHGNLKPENILLDSKLNCKICNFRLINKETIRSGSFRQYREPKGVFSFTDPEFSQTGNLTTKSDIYSFGMVILWLLTGRKSTGLASEVRKAVSDSKLASVLDESAGEWSNFVARRLADLGLQCCESNSRDRPVLTPILVKELKQLSVLEDRQVPTFFLCPILKEIMHDPQLAADGFTYEGEALRGWLENGHETSPMTNLKLSHLNLVPNHSLRLAIEDWLHSS